MSDINELIYSFKRDDYQIDNFDDFLRKVSFRYDIPSIHIGGTNGKSTVAYMLSNVYSGAYKTGLFLSSSVNYDLSEMIRINGEKASLKDIEKIFNDNQKLFKKYELSHFEISVYIAFEIFKKEKVDIAIIECGIGGELDATNIFTPTLSIITNIGIEHSELLGVSLSEIALHKAGIIKREVPVLIGNINGDALDVIVNISKKNDTKITRIGEEHNVHTEDNGLSFDYKTYEGLHIPNLSRTNVKNACLVIDAVDLLLNQFPVDENVLKAGLNKEFGIAKFELVKGEVDFLFDSAHNPDAIASLRRNIDQIMNKRVFVIFASFVDKNITVMLPEIGLLGKIYLTTFDHPKARKEEDYFLYLDEYQFEEDYHKIINDIKAEYPECMIVITGSTSFSELLAKEKREGKI